MNSLTFNFVVSWFVVKPKFVCSNMYSFPANWSKISTINTMCTCRLHWIISLTTCLNTTDGIIFFFKLQSTIRPVLLYKSASKLSNIYVHVQHNVNSVSITRSGVALCMLSCTWHGYTCNHAINMFVQTPTNNHTSPSPFQWLYVYIYLTTIIALFVQLIIFWVNDCISCQK